MSFFIFNVFINSLLAFFTVVLLIEGVIFLFRIRQGRVVALLRMIPILKLPLDLCLYDFSRWAYAQGINPLDCEEGTRILSVMLGFMSSVTDWLFLPITSGIQFTVSQNLTFTVADVVGQKLGSGALTGFSALFIFLSVAFLIRRLFLYRRSIVALDSLAKSSQPLRRKIRNFSLSNSLKKNKIPILTAPTLDASPFVGGLISPNVFIPRSLSQNLSRREYEAVLAHEMQHVRYKDNLVRLVLDFIAALFWWIPTKWLISRIEEGQEVSCDLKCKKYGIDQADLASALFKSAKYSTDTSRNIFAHHLTKHPIIKRVNILLEPCSTRFKKTHFMFTCLAIGIAFLVIFLGRFWTF